MTTTGGSARYAGLLPVPVRPTALENERFSNWQPSLSKRALRALSLLIAFCAGVAATFAWWSYGDATGAMIPNSYQRLGWSAPRHAATAQKAPDAIAPSGSAASHPDQRQLDAMLGDDLHAIRLSLNRIVAGQELITRSIDEMSTSIAARQEQMTRSTDETGSSVATGEPTTRRTDQGATSIGAGQGPMTRNTDQTTVSVDQAPSAKAGSITVESLDDAVSLQPARPSNVKLTEAKPPQTLSERGKQLAAASGHDASCFPSASAVRQNHPGGSPSWTLRAPGHEGTQCWHAAARPSESDDRPRAGDHRREMIPTEKEIVGTTENTLFPPPTPYRLAPQ
jgi:hypothetical protein